MSYLRDLTSLLSNTPLSKLAPSNRGAIKTSFNNLSKNSNAAKILRDANHEGKTMTDHDFHTAAQDSAEKMIEYGEKYNESKRDGGSQSKLNRLAGKVDRQDNDASTRMEIVKNHQAALGRSGTDPRDGTVLSGDTLKAFREKNNELLSEKKKGVKKAQGELIDHAKDYFFSGDLGTNAMRWGAVGVAYGAANVGLRTVSGGSATTNNQGQRDIAGIPFL